MQQSFLSEKIYALLHENAYLASSDEQLTADFLPFFESIENQLNLDVWDDSGDYYSRMVTNLRHHVFRCHILLLRLSTEKFLADYFPFIEWSPYASFIRESFKRWREPIPQSNENSFRTLLHLGYLLERSLGCIYVAISGKQNCPNMLKDMLSSGEIRTALGDPLVAYIKVFVGPVTSLNLRNLAWHGFLRPSDLHAAYTSVLFFLFVDIGRALQRSGRPLDLRPAVPGFNSSAVIALSPFFDVTSDSLLTFSRRLAANSNAVPPSLLPFFHFAFAALQGSPQPLSLLDALCVLLPLLEHVARHVFVRSNDLSASLLLASDGAFFCTFDDILAPFCSSGTPNRLPDVIGAGATSFLCDLLAYPAGPRLRDRLSHGEVALEMVSMRPVSALLAAFHCLLGPEPPDWTLNYRSRFHPIELCRAELSATMSASSSSLLCASGLCLLLSPARSLFRDTGLEPVLLLLRQINTVSSALQQSVAAFRRQREADLRAHQLRSRQRQNWTRFERCEPEIRRLTRRCQAAAVASFVLLACEEREAQGEQLADLRRLLVLCEKAQAGADRAKWGELREMLTAKLPRSQAAVVAEGKL